MGSCYCGKTPTQRRFSKIETLLSTWNISGFFDLNTLIVELPGIRASIYLSSQHLYKTNWNFVAEALKEAPEEKKSDRVKATVRKGVADSDMHALFALVVDLKDNSYLSELKIVFPREFPHDFEVFPSFSEHITIETVVPKVYINEDGKKSLKKLMWVLSNLNPAINYCPQMAKVASLLLIFNTEEETYVILKHFIHSSSHSKNFIEKHLTITHHELEKLVGIIMKVLVKKSEELIQYLEKKNIALKDYVSRVVMNFGINYFSFPLLSRLLSTFTIEGNKALIKIISSMFLLCSENLMSEDFEDFDRLLKSSFMSQFSVDLIIAKAFKLKLSKYNLEGAEVHLDLKNPKLLYRPFIEKPFLLFTETFVQLLWGILPHLYRSYRPVLVYSTKSHGMSLRTLLRNSSEHDKHTPMALAICTENKTLMGFFLDCSIRKTDGYAGGNDSFLFQLEPQFSIYKPTGKNNYMVNVTSDVISFGGGGHGPALSIDKYFGEGQSYLSDTFENPIFDSGFFNILSCETFLNHQLQKAIGKSQIKQSTLPFLISAYFRSSAAISHTRLPSLHQLRN